MTNTTPRVPVTIVTGFLGAGKTSLLNHLLTSDHGLRLAVLVNDFGAINIDADLIKNRDGEVVSLENGCICCSLADGLLASVMRLLRQDIPADHIVIETSGVSDPFEVANTFADPELQQYAPLDGIITVVDAELISDINGAAATLAARQIAAADIVLLNKADLVDLSQREKTKDWINRSFGKVRVLETVEGKAPVEMLLGIGGTEAPVSQTSVRRALEAPSFDSMTFETSEPLPAERLHSVLQQMPATIFRVKGFLYLAERPDHRCILQATGRRAMVTIGDPWEDETPRNRIVFIGETGGLDRDLLHDQLTGTSLK